MSFSNPETAIHRSNDSEFNANGSHAGGYNPSGLCAFPKTKKKRKEEGKERKETKERGKEEGKKKARIFRDIPK